MTDAPDQALESRVWVTVIDPATEDGRLAVTNWDQPTPVEWAVPGPAQEGDLVLGWVTGGTGFRYLLSIQGAPRRPSADEFGPQQAMLAVVEPIQPSLPMPRLKADTELRSWWLVRYNMQGVVRAQESSLTRDRQWGAFLQLLESVAPKAAAKLRGQRADAEAGGGGRSVPDTLTDDVAVLDEGSTTPVHMTVTRTLGSVLARASAINEKRDSADLSFSSLLLALLYGDDPLGRWLTDYFRTQGVKVEHTLSKVRKDAETARAAAGRATSGRDAILASPLRRTSSAREALEEASRIASAQPAPHVDSRHLVAALVALTDYHELDFGALTLDRPRWGAAFVQHVTGQADDAAEVEFWRRFYIRRFPGHELPPLEIGERLGHRPDYDADAYTSTDLLAIDDEVVALAYVIAAKQTRPPLAIGLFGEWGSGKTFFMKHLRRRIDRLCRSAQNHPASDRDCHAHIAQIEFNAWHYQEGDLWASLVDHILRNLRFGEDEEETKVSERRDQIVRELDTTEARQKAATARVAEAGERVDEADRLVAKLKEDEKVHRQELAEQLTPGLMLTAAREGLSVDPTLKQDTADISRELGLPQVHDSAAALQQALSEARNELVGAWAFLLPLWQATDRRRRLMLLSAALLAPIALAFIVYRVLPGPEALGKVGGFVAGLVVFIGTVTKWIGAQTQWVRGLRTRVESVAQKVESAINRQIEAALGDQKKAIEAKLAELEALRQDQARAQKERDEAVAQAATLRTSLVVLGDDGLMRAFLDDRIGGGVYQQKLGIAALVRRDFERLSRTIEQVTKREGKNQLKAEELVINRIVLYIDDLDRCEMTKVVPVLRAVHLLLAFPAFVVVVGVDSRWVARCLATHHPDIFLNKEPDGEPAVTPLDYLEKIFQIPIWLEPVPPERRVFMVRELLHKPVVVAAAAPRAVPTPQEEMQEEKPPPTGQDREGDRNARQPAEPRAPATAGAGGPEEVLEESDATPLDLKPRGLTVTDGEYEFLGQIGGLLSPSPRTIKRFVNTYRLINVALAQAGLRDSELRPRDSEIRMLLLAILVGMPDLSRWLQEALRVTNGANLAITPLMRVMDGSVPPDASVQWSRTQATAQWAMVLHWIQERGEPWTNMPAARVAEWLDPVGRYTFNLTRSAVGPAVPAGIPTPEATR